MSRALLLLFLGSQLQVCIPAYAADRAYPVYPVQEQIVLDGKLDETAWQGAALADHFIAVMGADIQETRFRMLYDGTNLYIGAIVFEANMGKLRLTHADGESTWQDDSLELFLMSEAACKGNKLADGKRYYRVAVNAAGKRSDTGTTAGASRIFSDDGQKEVGYTLEISIPLSLFGAEASAPRFLGNVARNAYTRTGGRSSSWAMLPRRGEVPDRYDIERGGAGTRDEVPVARAGGKMRGSFKRNERHQA